MKLFFDARFVRFTRHDGISRYSANLVGALAKHIDVTMIIHDQRQLDLLPDLPYVMLNNPSSPKELFIARTLNKLGAEIVFSPLQTMGSFGRRYILILTIHDLIYYTHKTPPRNLSALVRLGWWIYHSLGYAPQRFLLNRADLVITVSKTTKQLMRAVRITKRPIKVVYNAPSPLASHLEPSKKPSKNLVYMGSFMAYKNVETLIQALFYLPDYTLHCLSSISEQDKAELLALAPPNQLIFHNGVSDKKYAELLSSAHALVTASRDEGFGLPIIESLQEGVPVICSDLPIFHEVAGKCALFFDPDNPTEFSKHVISLENHKARQVLIKHGKQQAKKFDWDLSAKALLKAITDITE